MSAIETRPHYPTKVPVPIADLELALGALENVDDLSPEEAVAVSSLRLTLAVGINAQHRARSSHPTLDLIVSEELAGNITALPVDSNRGGAVDTGAQAARAIEVKVGDARAKVLAKLVEAGDAGRTDYEVDGLLGWEHGAAGKRRVELRTLGLVKRAPLARTRTLPGRRPAAVWVVTDKAAPCLEALGYTVTVEPGFIPELGDVTTVTAPT